MGLFDKVREAFGDDKTDGNGNNTSKNSYEVIFVEEKLGMTLSGAPDGTPAVTGGQCLDCYRGIVERRNHTSCCVSLVGNQRSKRPTLWFCSCLRERVH